jgi:ubiquinone/menaquinone biosynthesis C-methylase UbiE
LTRQANPAKIKPMENQPDSQFNDPDYLLNQQYKTGANLYARINLHSRFSANSYGWFRWVFDQLDLPAGCRLLELGCGTGGMWLDNLPRIPTGWDITLSDFSPGMLEQARENLQSRHSGLHFEGIDAQSIPYGEASFDAVIANHMLYHVPDRPRALAEIFRVLHPGGRFFATTIGKDHLLEMHRLVERFDPGLMADGWSLDNRDVGFTLENGPVQIAAYFSQVEMRRYPDELVITKAAPLVDYLLSMARGQLFPGRRAELTYFIENEMADAGGALHITKDSGVFLAKKL